MPISKVADRATSNSNTASTTHDLSLSGMTVGNLLIVRISAQNAGGGGAASSLTPSNQTGTPVDIASRRTFTQNNDPGAASAGVTCHVVLFEITDTSGTVRLTYGQSIVVAAVAEEWTGLDALASVVVGTPVGANGVNSTNLGSATDASVTAGNLAYAAVAVEGPSGDTFTQDADTTGGAWVGLTRVGTTLATATDNQTIAGAYKIPNATGAQTYDPTNGTARDSATLILELAIAVVAPNQGSASGGIGWAGSATGTRTPKGAATGSLSWAGSATGARVSAGAAEGIVTWGGGLSPIVTAGGDRVVTADGGLVWFLEPAVATGTNVAGPNEGAATGAVDWDGSATGTKTTAGAATGAISWAGSATGTKAPAGAATGAISWVGSATGEAPTVGAQEGAATGAVDWVGSATGARTSAGAATGSVAWVGSATGAKSTSGAASGTITWVGSATGTTTRTGAASGTVAWAGAATGETPLLIQDGSADGAITWVGSATGARTSSGAATGTVTWSGAATGARQSAAAATGTITWFGEAFGTTVRAGAATGAVEWVGAATGTLQTDQPGRVTSTVTYPGARSTVTAPDARSVLTLSADARSLVEA